GDSTRLSQVFSNLLNNAVKFSADGGRVDVRCEVRDDDALVIVEDQGQGMTRELLPSESERFVQADGSKTRAHGGLGLGLALVKSFVEAHQGTVEAESAGVGAGSRFTVRLPQQSIPAPRAEELAAVKAKPVARTANLLIIED